LGGDVWVGVKACPVVGCIDSGPGANVQYGVADATGNASVPNLDPAVEYEYVAMARNIDGCAPGYVDPVTGDQYWFAAGGPFTGTPAELDGTTFVISDNCNAPSIALRIVRADTNQPFALGGDVWVGVRVCPVVGCVDSGPGSNVVYGNANANGDITVLNLDPTVDYEFTAMASNIDGCSPGYVDPVTGNEYWFATGGSVTGTPAELDGTTFVISDNCSA
jgi:hypothetical protein